MRGNELGGKDGTFCGFCRTTHAAEVHAPGVRAVVCPHAQTSELHLLDPGGRVTAKIVDVDEDAFDDGSNGFGSIQNRGALC